MAKIRKQVLGKVSGAIGDLTFRVKNGMGFISTRPNSFTPGNDLASISRRLRFSTAVKYAKSVNDLASLRTIWKQYKSPQQSAFNYIMKYNYHAVLPDDISGSVSMVPEIGFSVGIDSSAIQQHSITVKINPIGDYSGIDPVLETKIQLSCVAFFKSPVSDEFSPFHFLSLLSEEESISLTDPIDFTIALADQQSQLFSQYNTHKLFFAFVTHDPTGKPIHFSDTYEK